MSDLISRSELYDQLANKLTWLMAYGDDVYLDVGSDIKDVIDNMPIAYDIDKAVEELEEMIHPKQLYFCKYARGGCKHLYNNDKDCMECIVENAIEIVKQSSVYDDVCGWKVFDNSLTDEPQWVYKTTCGKYIGEEHTLKAFVYCPYCSKKIKVME